MFGIVSIVINIVILAIIDIIPLYYPFICIFPPQLWKRMSKLSGGGKKDIHRTGFLCVGQKFHLKPGMDFIQMRKVTGVIIF